ncbi:methylmalonyl-CoA epimerase [Candidatus Nitrosocosmicus sp.]|nr:methylmalonyl-CoA epimerase [Candidatus Nitrosocosmicus sp.]
MLTIISESDSKIYIPSIANAIMRIDHIAIAVNDANLALENYKKILRVDKIDFEEVPTEKVKVVMLNLEDTRLELLEPMDDSSPISKFLRDRGEGIHHIAITADEIESDVKNALGKGMRFLGDIRTGSYGRKITFIHPKSLNGVLVEFCQAPPESH